MNRLTVNSLTLAMKEVNAFFDFVCSIPQSVLLKSAIFATYLQARFFLLCTCCFWFFLSHILRFTYSPVWTGWSDSYWMSRRWIIWDFEVWPNLEEAGHGLFCLPPAELQPARLLCPWNFPCKNAGVGCHFLPGILPDWTIEPASLKSPALAGGFFTTWATWDVPGRISIFIKRHQRACSLSSSWGHGEKVANWKLRREHAPEANHEGTLSSKFQPPDCER